MIYLTSQQIAEQLGITAKGVQKYAQRHGIGIKIPKGTTYLFTESDLELLKNRKTKPGRELKHA